MFPPTFSVEVAVGTSTEGTTEQLYVLYSRGTRFRLFPFACTICVSVRFEELSSISTHLHSRISVYFHELLRAYANPA